MFPLNKLLRGPIIGLLVIKDEADFLPEVLAWAAPLCDAIYGLLGDEPSRAVALECGKLAGYVMDSDVKAAPFKDHHRQVLLEMAQRDFPPTTAGGWFLILHGDEIWEDDPRVAALVSENMTQREGEPAWDTIVCDMAQFYLHPQGGEWVAWPPYKEQRMFRNVAGLNYPFGQNYKITPVGISGRHYGNYFPLVRHHAYRNPDQAWRMAYSQHIHLRCRQMAHDWILERRSCLTEAQPNTDQPLIPWEQAKQDAELRRRANYLPLAESILRRRTRELEAAG